VREWFGGETHTIEGNLVLPSDLPEGTYEIFLNLADESADLRTDLNYKMKVANTGLNDEPTGMIDLQQSVTVSVGESAASSNSGPTILVVCGMEQDVLPPEASLSPSMSPVSLFLGLVKNGGFEGSPETNWFNFQGGYIVEQTFKNSGTQSIKIMDGGAKQVITLNAEAGSQVTLRGYSKAVGTSTGLWDYGIYADVKYTDGSWLYGQIATFPGGTHDFTLAQKTFTVESGKTAVSLNLYAMYRNDPLVEGVAYFDDVEVTVVAPLVKNGGFEGSLEADWISYGNGYRMEQTFKRSGDQSIKITDGGAKQVISLNAEGGSQVTLKGYIKAVGTSTNLWDCGIYADVKYADGSWLYGQIATFPGGTHDFTLAQRTFTVESGKTAISMNLYAMYRNDPLLEGVTYFDDVEVKVEAPST